MKIREILEAVISYSLDNRFGHPMCVDEALAAIRKEIEGCMPGEAVAGSLNEYARGRANGCNEARIVMLNGLNELFTTTSPKE